MDYGAAAPRFEDREFTLVLGREFHALGGVNLAATGVQVGRLPARGSRSSTRAYNYDGGAVTDK